MAVDRALGDEEPGPDLPVAEAFGDQVSLTLISQTRDPYQTAFEDQKGSHLQVVLDGRVVDS
jgi:hypothetical protein